MYPRNITHVALLASQKDATNPIQLPKQPLDVMAPLVPLVVYAQGSTRVAAAAPWVHTQH